MLNILLLGPSTKSKGGIAAVIRNLISDSKRNTNIRFFSHAVNHDISAFFKVFSNLISLITFTFRLSFQSYDVVHFHPSEGIGFYRYLPYYLICRIFRKKTVFHMHGGRFDIFFSHQKNIFKKLILSLLKKCDSVICLSNSWKEYYLSLGIEAKVITNSISVEANNPYSIDSKSITFIGFIEKKKGIFDLIEALKTIELPQNYRVEICGTGDLEHLQNMISVTPLAEASTIHGWVDQYQKKEILKRTSIFILPSYFEALPMVLLEAMSYGIPVITTPVGGIPELVHQDINGILVNPGDIKEIASSIDTLLKNSEMRRYMSDNNHKKIVEEYNSKVTIMKFQDLYMDLTNKE